MTVPRPPRVRAATVVEADRNRALDDALRRTIDARAADSPYARLGDVLVELVADALHEALGSSAFASALGERGYRLVPDVDDDQVPDPPDDWAHAAVDLIGLTGWPVNPIDIIDELWRRAYRAGLEAAR